MAWRRAWTRWTGPEQPAARWSGAWWRHHAVVFTVFGVTGSSAMWLVRPQLYALMGVEGEATSGQRVASLLLMMPFYYAILLLVGTACGKYSYVKNMAMRPVRMFTRRKATTKVD